MTNISNSTDNFEDLIYLSNKISKFVVGFEGNVSKKNKGVITIKGSGKKLDGITSIDFVNYDFNLNQLNNFNIKGSMELDFHSYLLSFEDIHYVCHTHPTNLLKILCTDKINDFAEKRFFPDQVIFNGDKSLVIPYISPGIKLQKSIEESLNLWMLDNKSLPKIILLKNHGLITFGKTVEECIIKTEICDKSAEIFIGSLSIGDLNPLTKQEITELINDDKEKYRLSNL